VLGQALADLARRNQQDFLCALKRCIEGGGIGIVRPADLHAQRGEIGGLLRIAHGGDDPAGRDFGQQGLDDEAAELAGGSGDDDHDANSSGNVG
jgi:hypothetical protein